MLAQTLRGRVITLQFLLGEGGVHLPVTRGAQQQNQVVLELIPGVTVPVPASLAVARLGDEVMPGECGVPTAELAGAESHCTRNLTSTRRMVMSEAREFTPI